MPSGARCRDPTRCARDAARRHTLSAFFFDIGPLRVARGGLLCLDIGSKQGGQPEVAVVARVRVALTADGLKRLLATGYWTSCWTYCTYCWGRGGGEWRCNCSPATNKIYLLPAYQKKLTTNTKDGIASPILPCRHVNGHSSSLKKNTTHNTQKKKEKSQGRRIVLSPACAKQRKKKMADGIAKYETEEGGEPAPFQ